MTNEGTRYQILTILLRIALVLGLLLAGWLVYTRLPGVPESRAKDAPTPTSLHIVLQAPISNSAQIPIELYPVDIVAVRHEYFAERREGKRFDDFLTERMKGRTPISASLDKDGRTTIMVPQGSWWVHALVSGDESFEWRLHIDVAGTKQTVLLTPQNAYTRAKSF